MPVLPTRTSRRRAPALALAAALLATVLVPGASAQAKVLHKITWLSKTTITEYYPAPERWFVGARVQTPGVDRASRIDWLYSARGLSMEGDGIGLDNKPYHIAAVGSSGWISQVGKHARFGTTSSIFAPFWRGGGYWRNAHREVTYPLESGGWFNGAGKQYVSPGDITFAPGVSRDLRYYRSVAVDPKLIPLGSLVYVPAYKPLNGDGWFRADDTGGAIKGRHIDVYRRPPEVPSDQGRYLPKRRIFVVPVDKISAYLRGTGGGASASAARAGSARLPRPPAALLRRR